ncbi:hypothetical protein Desdi_0522 [Desulfitobacterium dichloroeliminans LMG P-21439]|uniref:Uncharacterized protein n=1 Tax=Desulfitobacterium dichloroeliminans (strain LMG P-21439 / DCA1) TaxID=871963 RepID=L0F4W9_DESDL|nr:hypothetical protein [Desulfitobacterium dichloroeliminans]AGA68060.1 hypothetical protein Desdi_0522 [Desulfitobacterium dichloroeliminans LMG P-21439]
MSNPLSGRNSYRTASIVELAVSNDLPDISSAKNDYDLAHKDIVMVRNIEKHLKLFEIFKLRNSQMIVLILAGAKTLASEAGRFSLEEAHKYLGYMSKRTRDKVLRELQEKGWIVFDGFDYEVPGKVRSFLSSMFLAFAKENLSMEEQIKTTVMLAEFVDEFNMDEEQTESIKNMGFRELAVWQGYLKRVIQKKSRREILEIGKQTQGIIKVIKETQRTLNSNRKLFSRTKYDEFFDVTSSILDLTTQILAMAIQFQRESQKGLGEFISPEMIEVALHEASKEILAGFAEKNFSAPKQVYQLREEVLGSRSKAFFENEKEEIIATPAPEPVDIVEEEMIVDRTQSPMELFYQELVLKMKGKDDAPMDELLFQDLKQFGQALYKTGQLLKLTGELRNQGLEVQGKEVFELIVNDSYKELKEGPVELVTDCLTRRVSHGSD